MQKMSTLVLLGLAAVNVHAQWSHAGGSTLANQPGSYGSKGVPAAANELRARFTGASWVDSSGMFWVFGGSGIDALSNEGMLNDLWRYDPASAQWTWMKGSSFFAQAGSYGTQGVEALTNNPCSRIAAISWSNPANDKLYLFGGMGFNGTGTGDLNDLWSYNISTDNWTWMAGSSATNTAGVYGTMGTPAPGNMPGGRREATSWIDASGNLWLFGGYGWDDDPPSGEGLLNDLWRYNVATNEWTWVKGYNKKNQFGQYSAPARPGARRGAASWVDKAGNFWLFGGLGWDDHGSTGMLSDLWKYDPVLNEWTFIKGAQGLFFAGVYGTQNVAAPTNMPGSRRNGMTWTDAAGNLWLFGGTSNEFNSYTGKLSDLWKFDMAKGQWIWVGGPGYVFDQPGYSKGLGVVDAANIPGARDAAFAFTDKKSHFWLLAGTGKSLSGATGYLNDLWGYTIDLTSADHTLLQPGKNYSIYPNPSAGLIHISATTIIEEIVVTDMMGRTIHHLHPGQKNVSLAITNPGIYTVSLISGSTVIVERLVVNGDR